MEARADRHSRRVDAACERVEVPFFDARREFEALGAELASAMIAVGTSGHYILGPECERLERSVAAYCQADHAVACASGSDALLLALMALGVTADHEVIIPSFTFFATASAIWRLGARPVFVDIDPATFNMDPQRIAQRISPATKAIIPVHLFGQCAEMDRIAELARRHGLKVIEDAAQAIGAEYQGRRAGSLSDIACFSFYPTKNLACLGDGGILTTRSADHARRLRMLRQHGMEPRYHHHAVGINSRLDEIQAAVLNVKLPHLERATAQRTRNAGRYAKWFAQCGLDQVLTLPAAVNGRHVWNQYVIRVPDGLRDELKEHLQRERIGTEIYYPVPLDQQPCFRDLYDPREMLPETRRACRELLALPIFPQLTAREQIAVVQQIAAFFGRRTRVMAAVPRPKFLSSPSAAADKRTQVSTTGAKREP